MDFAARVSAQSNLSYRKTERSDVWAERGAGGLGARRQDGADA